METMKILKHTRRLNCCGTMADKKGYTCCVCSSCPVHVVLQSFMSAVFLHSFISSLFLYVFTGLTLLEMYKLSLVLSQQCWRGGGKARDHLFSEKEQSSRPYTFLKICDIAALNKNHKEKGFCQRGSDKTPTDERSSFLLLNRTLQQKCFNVSTSCSDNLQFRVLCCMEQLMECFIQVARYLVML